MARVPREASGVWAVFCFWIYLLVISTCVHFGKSLTCIFIICILFYRHIVLKSFQKQQTAGRLTYRDEIQNTGPLCGGSRSEGLQEALGVMGTHSLLIWVAVTRVSSLCEN